MPGSQAFRNPAPLPPKGTASEQLHDIELGVSLEAQPDRNARPSCFQPAGSEILFLVVAAFVGATFPIIQRASVVIAGSVRTGLGLSDAEFIWIPASTGLATGAFILPIALLLETSRSGIPSRTVVLQLSQALFCVLAVAASTAHSGIYLDIICAAVGIVCAVQTPVVSVSTLAIAYDEGGTKDGDGPRTPRRTRRNLALAFFFASGNPIAITFGGIGAGWVTMAYSWRTAFVSVAVLLVVISIAAVVMPLCLPCGRDIATALERRPSSLLPCPAKFDWLALLLLVSGVALVSSALTIAPDAPSAWSTPYVWLMVAVGLLCLVCMIVWENITAQPILPPIIWKDCSLGLILLFNACSSMLAICIIFWLPFFMQEAQGLTPLDAALRMLPQAIAGLVLSPVVGLLIDRVHDTVILTVSALFQVFGCTPFLLLDANSNYFELIVPALILNTAGMDWSVNVAVHRILLSIPTEQRAMGAAAVQAISRLAIPVGLAITSAVYSSFGEQSDGPYPELAFRNVFYTMFGMSLLGMLLIPLIHTSNLRNRPHDIAIATDGKCLPPEGQGFRVLSNPARNAVHPQVSTSKRPSVPPKEPTRAFPVQPRSSSLLGCKASFNRGQVNSTLSQNHNEQSAHSKRVDPRAGRIISRITISNLGEAPPNQVVWLVCDECGEHKRLIDPISSNPARYFYDNSGALARQGKGLPPLQLSRSRTSTSHYGRSLSKCGSRTRRRAQPLPPDPPPCEMDAGGDAARDTNREAKKDNPVSMVGGQAEDAAKGRERSDSAGSLDTILRKFPLVASQNQAQKAEEKFAGAVMQLKEITQAKLS